jgi:hypothetical protein
MNTEKIVEQAWMDCSTAETMAECLEIIAGAKSQIENSFPNAFGTKSKIENSKFQN